jgi:hypothetical protein
MADAEVLTRELSTLARDSRESSQRAWAALTGMTTRVCGRYSAEGRAVAAAAAAGGPDPVCLVSLAGLLARRADNDDRFAAGFVPWLAAAQLLLRDCQPDDR